MSWHSLKHLTPISRKAIRKILLADAAVYRLFPQRIPSTIEAPFLVIAEADEICNRLGHPSWLWRSVFRGLDAELQDSLAARRGTRLGRHEPESGVVDEVEEPVGALPEMGGAAMQ